MHKKLIIEAFEEAKKNEELKGVKKPSKNYISKILSDFIDKEVDFVFGDRSLKNYYNEAIKKVNENDDINISQLNVIIGLCKYLGYEDYENYILSNNNEDVTYGNKLNNGKSLITIKTKNKKFFAWFSNASAANKLLYAIIISMVFTAGIAIGYFKVNEQRWMVWNRNHYVEVKFDDEKYDIGQLKFYKEERIKNFKKVNVDCNTLFFNEDKSVKVWYGKNNKKELEYFTDFGLHPETGKTLKPISEYMIEKHICQNYK